MASGHLHEQNIDAYAQLQSPFHQWEMRLKIVALFVLMIAFALVNDVRLLPAMIAVTLVIYAMAKLPWSFLRSRLTVPGYFIIALVIFLPFVAGSTPLAEWGGITIRQEGLEQAVLIVGRFFCIFTTAIVLFSTNTFLNAIRALRGLRFPDIMADMLLLTYRYLFEIGNLFTTIRTAARLRGFDGSLFAPSSFKTLTSLAGHLLVRSYEQSQQVYTAMVLRGYGTQGVKIHHAKPIAADYLKAAVIIGTAVLLLITQGLIQ